MLVDTVRPDRAKDLASLLEEIDRDPSTNPYMRCALSPSTHFARMVIMGGEGYQRLLTVINFDGPIMDYLQELAGLTPGLGSVFGTCVRYQEGMALIDYVRATWCPPRGVYDAFPGLTATEIKRMIELRQCLGDVADALDQPSDPVLAKALSVLSELPIGGSPVVRAARAIDRAWARAAGSLQVKERDVLLTFAEWFSKQGQAKDFPLVYPVVGADSLGDQETATAIQNVSVGGSTVHNGMTTLTTIRPSRLARLQVALAGTSVLAYRSWPPGQFAGVGTLHWFAWTVIDPLPGDPALAGKPGKQLIFVSVFDGAWKNYMQDFIDKLVWGLDGLYGNTYDYPPAGMKDTNAFTRFILDHQWAPQVFYSSYPSETVMNLMKDNSIAAGLPKGADTTEAIKWLKLL
jgi:hypothetical protein